MKISILFTFLLLNLLLGALFPQEGKMCPFQLVQINAHSIIKYNLQNSLSQVAVKFIQRRLYMLNTIISISTQKATKTSLNQTENLKFQG